MIELEVNPVIDLVNERYGDISKGTSGFPLLAITAHHDVTHFTDVRA